MELATHQITLHGSRIRLRPLTEADWPDLFRWNSDPEVLYFSEGDQVQAYTLPEVQAIYRSVSQSALCFIIESGGRPVGECWLQRMNLERILREYPGQDLRRIDLLIGEKTLWGQGLGTEAIRLLTGLAFDQENADYVFAVDVADFNMRSRRAFEKNDYRLVARNLQPAGAKFNCTLDFLAKNPRQGFHAYAVHLYLDRVAQDAVYTVWRELAESGTAPYLYQSASRPHISLSVYRALDLPAARQRLADLSSRLAPLPVNFIYVGIFPGAQPTLYLGPQVTPDLWNLQAQVCQILDPLGALPGYNYYRPGTWHPHCTLAVGFDAARLTSALQIAMRLPLPLTGQIRAVGLTEEAPVRHIGQWPFLNQHPSHHKHEDIP